MKNSRSWVGVVVHDSQPAPQHNWIPGTMARRVAFGKSCRRLRSAVHSNLYLGIEFNTIVVGQDLCCGWTMFATKLGSESYSCYTILVHVLSRLGMRDNRSVVQLCFGMSSFQAPKNLQCYASQDGSWIGVPRFKWPMSAAASFRRGARLSGFSLNCGSPSLTDADIAPIVSRSRSNVPRSTWCEPSCASEIGSGPLRAHQ